MNAKGKWIAVQWVWRISYSRVTGSRDLPYNIIPTVNNAILNISDSVFLLYKRKKKLRKARRNFWRWWIFYLDCGNNSKGVYIRPNPSNYALITCSVFGYQLCLYESVKNER